MEERARRRGAEGRSGMRGEGEGRESKKSETDPPEFGHSFLFYARNELRLDELFCIVGRRGL